MGATLGHQNGGGRASHYDPVLSSDFLGNMWQNAPILEWLHDPSIAVYYREDFGGLDATDDWTGTQGANTNGAAALSIAASGVLEIDSESTTAREGFNFQRTGGQFIVPVAGTEIWFETEIKVVDTFDKAEIFIGLSEVDTAILDTSAMASTNVLAWWCVTDDGVLLFGAEKGGTGATKAAATIEEATYIKLGFYVNGITSAQQYINGVSVGAAHATANVPIVKLVPSFVCQSGGTNDPIMHVKGYRVFQTRA